MRNRLILSVSVFILIVVGYLFSQKNKKLPNEYVIGILQTASFPALDNARNGFMNEMKKELGDNVKFIVQNAQGSLTQAQAVASSFQANKDIDAFYAIATPALEALKQQIKDRPILFAAVTDPQGLHIHDGQTNITGCTDKANVKKEIEILKLNLPNIKKVSLLYSAGEPNSSILVKEMKEELQKQNIFFEDDVANGISEVMAAATHAATNGDAILIPTDNIMASSISMILDIANKNKKPVVVTWTGEINHPFMQFGVNYTNSGELAAQQLLKIKLEKIIPQNVSIETPQPNVILNKKAIL